mmetsp:Transcript_40218/g.94185  ORF Transcript_40218/g.94185 Transcript_40218/m.94185 type:complete len:414 (+) Transcript_40218:45-1286(+)
MDIRGGLLIVGLAAAFAVPLPAGVAPAKWPLGTATASDSNASWSGGFQPYRMFYWQMDAQGRPAHCWETTVLHDRAKGWPGLCVGLFHTGLEKVTDEKTCKDACFGDPRCSVWQFVTQVDPPQCWLGNGGYDCDFRGGNQNSITVQASQRLQHGKVHVMKSLVGIKVNKLYNFGLYAEGSQELSISRCRDWCYSSISCEYWQYSKNDGCWVDAPSLSSKRGNDVSNVVDYPLTAASVTTGTPEANSMIAGEYITHYCPPQQVPIPIVAGSSASSFVADRKPASSGPNPTVLILSLLLVAAAIGGLAYYCIAVAGKKRKGRDRVGLRQQSEADEDDDDVTAAKMANYSGYQQASFQQPPSPPRYPPQGGYGGQPPTQNFQTPAPLLNQGAPYAVGGGMRPNYSGQYGGYNARVM